MLNCDAQNTEAYLALGGLYMEQERYTDAIDLLKKAYDLTGEKRSFRGPLTEAYLARAEELMDKGEPKTAIARLKKAVERYVEPQDVRGLFSEACLMRAMQIRDAGELEQALRYLDEAEPELVEEEVFKDFRIAGYLQMGADALQAGEFATAKFYYYQVSALDPENEEAQAALELLREDAEEKLLSATVRGSISLELSASVFGGMGIKVPVSGSFTARYDGSDAQRLKTYFAVDVSADIMGQARKIYRESYSIGNGVDRDVYERSDMNGTWTQSEKTGGSDTADAERMLADYAVMAQEGTADAAKVVVNEELCTAVHDHKSGSDYLALLGGDLSGTPLAGMEELLKGADVSVNRYISVDTGRVVRCEADLSGSDISGLAELVRDYVGGVDASFTLSGFTIVFNVTSVNQTTVNLPAEVEAGSYELFRF